jgi:hypothetical protein
MDLAPTVESVREICTAILVAHDVANEASSNPTTSQLGVKLMGHDRDCQEFEDRAYNQLLSIADLHNWKDVKNPFQPDSRDPSGMGPITYEKPETVGDVPKNKPPPNMAVSFSTAQTSDWDHLNVCGNQRILNQAISPSYLATHCDRIHLVLKGMEIKNYRKLSEAWKNYQKTGDLAAFIYNARRYVKVNGVMNRYLRDLRERRQVVAGLLGAAGLFVAETVLPEFKDLLGLGTGTSTSVAHLANENMAHVKYLGAEMKDISAVQGQLKKKLFVSEEIQTEYDHLVELKELTFRTYQAVFLAIEEVRTSRRLSPIWVSPGRVYSALSQLTKRVKGDRQTLLIRTQEDVWHLDTSFILFQNLTITLIVHIPVGAENTELMLYEYIPTPLEMKDVSQKKFMVRPPRTWLAVRAGTGFSHAGDVGQYLELTREKLDECKSLGDLHYCPAETVLQHSRRQSCLSALYWNLPPTVKSKCPLAPVEIPSYAVHLSGQRYIVALEEESSLLLKCQPGGLIWNKRVKGVFRIDLPDGCSLEDEARDGFHIITLVQESIAYPIYNVSVDIPALLHNESMQWALAAGKFRLNSGSPGPSVADVIDGWTFHKVSEERKKGTLERLFDNLVLALAVTCSVLLTLLVGKCIFDACMRRADKNRLQAVDQATTSASETALAARATAQAARTEATLAMRMRELEERERRLDEEERRSLVDEPLLSRRHAYPLGLPRSTSLRAMPSLRGMPGRLHTPPLRESLEPDAIPDPPAESRL